MAKVPEQPTADAQIRNLQDQVRRLWTRIPPSASNLQFFNVTDEHLYNDEASGEGWFLNSYMTFVKDGNIVHIIGTIEYHTISPTTYPHASKLWVLRETALPDNFKPDNSRGWLITSGSFEVDQARIWHMFLFDNGLMQLAGSHDAVSPPPLPWGRLSEPDPLFVQFTVSYPVIGEGEDALTA